MPKGKLGHLESYDFVKAQVKYCDECHKKTKQEVYNGNTFADGSKIVYCLNCKTQMLV